MAFCMLDCYYLNLLELPTCHQLLCQCKYWDFFLFIYWPGEEFIIFSNKNGPVMSSICWIPPDDRHIATLKQTLYIATVFRS